MVKISLTGHRPKDLFGYDIYSEDYNSIRNRLSFIIRSSMSTEPVWCHSGLALGADTIWAEEALRFKKDNPKKVKIWAEIPHLAQADAWSSKSAKATWQTIVDNADEQTVYAEEYTPWCMQKRNIGMLDHGDQLIAVWDGTLKPKSGTSNAVKYWFKGGKKYMLVIRPNDNYIRKDLVNKSLLSAQGHPLVADQNELTSIFNDKIEAIGATSKETERESNSVLFEGSDCNTYLELIEEVQGAKFSIFTIKEYKFKANILINTKNTTYRLNKK